MKVLKVYIQDRTGDYNLEKEYTTLTYLSEVVEAVQREDGYYTEDQEGREVFVPYHQIEFIRKEKGREI
jgi:hypothetical protein